MCPYTQKHTNLKKQNKNPTVLTELGLEDDWTYVYGEEKGH